MDFSPTLASTDNLLVLSKSSLIEIGVDICKLTGKMEGKQRRETDLGTTHSARASATSLLNW